MHAIFMGSTLNSCSLGGYLILTKRLETQYIDREKIKFLKSWLTCLYFGQWRSATYGCSVLIFVLLGRICDQAVKSNLLRRRRRRSISHPNEREQNTQRKTKEACVQFHRREMKWRSRESVMFREAQNYDRLCHFSSGWQEYIHILKKNLRNLRSPFGTPSAWHPHEMPVCQTWRLTLYSLFTVGGWKYPEKMIFHVRHMICLWSGMFT